MHDMIRNAYQNQALHIEELKQPTGEFNKFHMQ